MKKKSAFHSVRLIFGGGFFKLRVLFGVLLCFAGVTIVLLALGKASAQPRTPAVQINPRWDGFNAASKIAPWVMEHTANGQEAEFFVVLADQADLARPRVFGPKLKRVGSYSKLCKVRLKQRKTRFCNCCATAPSSIARSTSLTQFWSKGLAS